MEISTVIISEVILSMIVIVAILYGLSVLKASLGEILAIIAPGEVEDELRQKADELEKLQSQIEAENNLVEHYRKEIVPKLEQEIKKLKADRTIEEREIKHMIKLDREAWVNEKIKFEQDTTAAKNAEIFGIKEEYLGRQISALNEQAGRSDALLEKILARLPNANLEISEDRNTTRDQLAGK